MRIPIQLIDSASGEPVEAELFDDITIDHFMETQREWRPIVMEVSRRLYQSNAPTECIPRHFHWDWTSKEYDLRLLAIRFLGIMCENKLQGLIKLDIAGQFGRIASQLRKPLVYVDYLETAPWNIKPLMRAMDKEIQFSGIGTRLIEAAVRLSMDEGFKGRVALHSLTGAEKFYLDVCGMTAVARDAEKQNLLWCEFTAEQGKRFLV